MRARVGGDHHRGNPILQTLVGPGEEHVSLAGIPTEGSLVQALEDALPGLVTNVYSHPAGGGKYLAILQIHKRDHNDRGRERQAQSWRSAPSPR